MQKDDANLQSDTSEHNTKSRWILLGAFGGMLFLMILAGVDSLHSLQKLDQVSDQVTRQLSTRSHALVTIVVSFHTYTDQMEQYLLSDEIASNSPAAAEVKKRGDAVHTALAATPRTAARKSVRFWDKSKSMSPRKKVALAECLRVAPPTANDGATLLYSRNSFPTEYRFFSYPTPYRPSTTSALVSKTQPNFCSSMRCKPGLRLWWFCR